MHGTSLEFELRCVHNFGNNQDILTKHSTDLLYVKCNEVTRSNASLHYPHPNSAELDAPNFLCN